VERCYERAVVLQFCENEDVNHHWSITDDRRIGSPFNECDRVQKKFWIDGCFEFLPRLLFLEAIFGYLCFMIFFKWGINYMQQDQENLLDPNNTKCPDNCGTAGAPVLLNELIYMFLSGPKDDLYDGQSTAQTALVAIAFISIPIMFLPKPFILRWQNSRKQQKAPPATTEIINHQEDDRLESTEEVLDDENVADRPVAPSKGKGKEKEREKPVIVGHEEGEEEFQFGEVMIHQLLETIEFILGSVSHTASYLRLWALSLAHSELATVFWQKIMFEVLSLTVIATPSAAVYIETGLITFAGFSVWFVVTLLVMMWMELLSALLHALRLHWVEFQSKFYRGDGYPFVPFSLRKAYNRNRIADVVNPNA